MNKFFNTVAFKLKKNAPQIMTAVGIAGVLGAVGYTAYVSYKKTPKIIEDHKAGLEAARADVEPDVAKRQSLQVYGTTALKLVKTYAIPASVLGASIACIVKSDNIQTKRFNEVSAALGLTAAAYDELKKRIAGEIGEEKLNDILMGADMTDKKGKEFEEVNTETGEITKEKCKKQNDIPLSMYAVCFDEANPNWKKEPYYNRWFLTSVNKMLNDRLMAKGDGGVMYLAEVLKDYGFSVENGNLTQAQALAAQVVGWRYDKNHPDKLIDIKIDDGFYDPDSCERSCWIDFLNVNGNLYGDLQDEVYSKKA